MAPPIQSRPRDHTDVAGHIARDLADITSRIAPSKGEANAHLRDFNDTTLRLRIENSHPAVEAGC